MSAVAATTAFELRSDRWGSVSSHPPVRTCIGCRKRAPANELFRVVVAPETTGTLHQTLDRDVASGPGSGGCVPVVPDLRRRASGRGAWVHRDLGCVEFAVQRRAFGRALRVSRPIDPEQVLHYVAQDTPSVLPPPAEPRRR